MREANGPPTQRDWIRALTEAAIDVDFVWNCLPYFDPERSGHLGYNIEATLPYWGGGSGNGRRFIPGPWQWMSVDQ